jgi:oxygen-independent coproporphyrinogen-3 oxidase
MLAPHQPTPQTPSLVPPEQLSRILGVLQAQYGIAPAAELSLEADPGTFDAARLQEYRTMGITRVSVGVQCFQQVSVVRAVA